MITLWNRNSETDKKRTKRRLNFRELYFTYSAHNNDSSIQIGDISNSIDYRHAIENDPLSTGAGE